MIRVVLLCRPEEDVEKTLLVRLRQAYGVGAAVVEQADMPRGAYLADEGAYDAIRLLDAAPRVDLFGDDKVLYVTDRPLRLPAGPLGTGPVDGFAEFGGKRAVVTADDAGLPPTAHAAGSLAKRATRQVGHLFSLHHCHDAKCSMLPGWAPQFDQTPDAVLCVFCRDKSDRHIREMA